MKMKSENTGHRETAVKATRDFLISLLLAEQWCAARQVGTALETLVNSAKSLLVHRGNYEDESTKIPIADRIGKVNEAEQEFCSRRKPL
jgi:hypothetical protein